MRIIKWLLSLAETKPLIFSIAILLVAIGISMSLIRYQEKRTTTCENKYELLQQVFINKLDSFNTAIREIEEKHRIETEEVLHYIIEDYRSQLDEQRKVNKEVEEVLSNNDKVLNRTRNKIKKLDR